MVEPIQTNAPVSILSGVVAETETAGRPAWDEAYRLWLDSTQRKSAGPNTVGTYQIAWRQFFDWARLAPWHVTPLAAQQWAAWLSQQGKAGRDGSRGPLAKKSVNLKIAALASFYRYVQRNTDLWPADRRNPFEAVEVYKTDPYDSATYPSDEEAKALLAAINRETLGGQRDYALLYTFLVTCRRSSEILNLKWGDLTPSNSQPGDWVFTYRYKGGKLRKAVLEARCYQAICDYLATAGRLATIQADDIIFQPVKDVGHLNNIPAETNRPLSNGLVNKLLKRYARRAGVEIKKAHVHGLRHAGARRHVWQMKRSGAIDYDEIMQLLGHANIAVTQIYIQAVLQDPESSTARPVARYFGDDPTADSSADEMARLRAEIARLQAELAHHHSK